MKQRITKITLLAAGLALSLVLMAKVWFEKTYDTFIPDKERVYLVTMKIGHEGKEPGSYLSTPGGVAPGLMYYCPGIEIATRTTPLLDNVEFYDEDGIKRVAEMISVADSCFFKIMGRKALAGNITSSLAIDLNIAIPSSFASRLCQNKDYGSLVGKKLKFSDMEFSIAGVYEDFPLNAEFGDNPIFLALPSIKWFMYDGTQNWNGNERYRSYVKLTPANDRDAVNKAIELACKEHLPLEELEKSNVTYTFEITPADSIHGKFTDSNKTSLILLVVAVILLVASIMNYVLFTLSSMIKRSKTVAVLKCYGAEKWNIRNMLLKDTIIDLLISVVLALALVAAFAQKATYLIGTPLEALFQGNVIILFIGVFIALFLVGGFIPASVYANIPVTAAFKNLKEGAKGWKYALLFVQFTLSALFITLFVITFLEYHKVTSTDPGYRYERLAYCNMNYLPAASRDYAMEEAKKLSCVEDAALLSTMPFYGQSGNNIYLPEDTEKSLFNIADLYMTTANGMDILEIPIVEGRSFEPGTAYNEILVSETFKKKMAQTAGWTDGCVGKSVLITEHSDRQGDRFVIRGVFRDFTLGSLQNVDKRGMVQFYYNFRDSANINWAPHLFVVKLTENTPQNRETVQNFLNTQFPDKELNLLSAAVQYEARYAKMKQLRDSVIVATIVTIFITIMGIVAYSIEESNRRRKEMSIRKVNGASVGELIALVLKRTLYIAIFAVVIGGIGAYYAGKTFLSLFETKIDLSWYLFAGCGVFTMLVIIAVSAVTVWQKANLNPIENLKSE